MLYNMHSEKVNKIIFAHRIKGDKEKIDEEGYDFALFQFLFKGISLRKYVIQIEEVKMQETLRLSLRIKDRYHCSILIMTCG